MISCHHTELPGHTGKLFSPNTLAALLQSQPAFCCPAVEHSENVFLVVESVINISGQKRESMSAASVQCGVSAMCFREQSVSAV